MSKKPTVYLETSVISYYTGNPSRDYVALARQHLTVMWWKSMLPKVDCYVSEYVLEEILEGDEEAAEKRKKVFDQFSVLKPQDGIFQLAETYLKKLGLPAKAQLDTLHVACATIYKLDYLLTWNCKHIANVFLKKKIEQINEKLGYDTPVICMPEEFMEIYDAN